MQTATCLWSGFFRLVNFHMVLYMSCRWDFGDGSGKVSHTQSAPCQTMDELVESGEKQVYVQDSVDYIYSIPGKHTLLHSPTFLNHEWMKLATLCIVKGSTMIITQLGRFLQLYEAFLASFSVSSCSRACSCTVWFAHTILISHVSSRRRWINPQYTTCTTGNSRKKNKSLSSEQGGTFSI